MISVKNSLTLALTKLKARKIRNILTVVIASLMFAVLFFAVIVFEGFFAVSLPRFANETLSSKNMTVATMYDAISLFKNGKVSNEQKVVLDRYWNEDILARQRRSKELGLPFDEKAARKETQPYEAYEEDRPNELWPVDSAPAVKRLVKEQVAVEQETREQKIKKYVKNTKAVKVSKGYQLRAQSRQVFLKNQNGEYAFPTNKKSERKGRPDDRVPSVESLLLVPQEAYQAFLFNNNDWKAESKRVPIMLSINKVEYMLGLPKLSQDASPVEKSKRLQDIQKKSKDLIFSACYLNSVAMNQHSDALSYAKMTPVLQKDIKLAYAPIASNNCSVPQIMKDTRDAEDRKMENNSALFEHEFNGLEIQPEAQEVTFQVVGMLPPDRDYSEGLVDSTLRMLAGSADGENYVPMDMFMKLENRLDVQKMYAKPEVNNLENIEEVTDSRVFFFEYKTPELVKDALDLNVCANMHYGVFEGEKIPKEIEVRCKKYKPEFFASSFGSRAADLLSVKETFRQIILIVGAVFAAIATIIMMGTIGRVISDSRRETAVFRAIGFKRFDIIKTYLTYGLILAGVTAAVAFGLALLVANILNTQFAPMLTAKANWIYCVRNFDLKFTLIGLNGELLGMIVLAILVIGLVATGLPLTRNIRRNPIRDMRDE